MIGWVKWVRGVIIKKTEKHGEQDLGLKCQTPFKSQIFRCFCSGLVKSFPTFRTN